MDRLNRWLDDRLSLFTQLRDETRLLPLVDLLASVLRGGNRLLVFGNGGSATQASHFAAELVNRFYRIRRALPVLALTTDMAVVTSIANDIDFRSVFARQVEAFGRPGDAALGLTTSGHSANVLLALERARQMEIHTTALCGKDDTDLQKIGVERIISIPAGDTPLVQEAHLFFLHLIAALLEEEIDGSDQ